MFIFLYYPLQSTLINMIMKKDKPDDGLVLVGETVKLALVGQDRYKNMKCTVSNTYDHHLPTLMCFLQLHFMNCVKWNIKEYFAWNIISIVLLEVRIAQSKSNSTIILCRFHTVYI